MAKKREEDLSKMGVTLNSGVNKEEQAQKAKEIAHLVNLNEGACVRACCCCCLIAEAPRQRNAWTCRLRVILQTLRCPAPCCTCLRSQRRVWGAWMRTRPLTCAWRVCPSARTTV